MDPILLIISGLMFVVLLILAATATSLYKTVKTNEAMVITGGGIEPQVLIGGGTVVLPIVQQYSILSLELQTIDLKNTSPFRSSDDMQFYLDAVIEAHVGRFDAAIRKAALNFGSQDDVKTMRSTIYDIVYDQIRHLLSCRTSAQILDNIELLTEDLKQCAALELEPIGIELAALRIKKLRSVPRSGSSSGEQKEPPHEVAATEELVGCLAVVSAPVSSGKPGEVTYKLSGGTMRLTRPAGSQLIGARIETGTTVVITAMDKDKVLVEPWTDLHSCLPSQSVQPALLSLEED